MYTQEAPQATMSPADMSPADADLPTTQPIDITEILAAAKQ